MPPGFEPAPNRVKHSLLRDISFSCLQELVNASLWSTYSEHEVWLSEVTEGRAAQFGSAVLRGLKTVQVFCYRACASSTICCG